MNKIIYVTKQHWINYLIPVLVGVIGVQTVILPIIMLIIIMYKRKTTSYITEHCVGRSSGFKNTKISEINLRNIENIKIQTGVIGSGGTVTVIGSGGTRIKFKNIANARLFNEMLSGEVNKVK